MGLENEPKLISFWKRLSLIYFSECMYNSQQQATVC